MIRAETFAYGVQKGYAGISMQGIEPWSRQELRKLQRKRRMLATTPHRME